MSEPHATPHGDEPLPEGEEAPPPGTRAMGIVRWSLVGLMAVAAAAAWIHHATSGGVLSHAERYHCPMHPTVVATAGGECPICGMDLVLVAPGAGEGGGERGGGHAGHGEAAGAPAAAGPSAAHGAPAGPLYECPMKCDPKFVTPDPKARCPVCGMKLAPVAPAVDAPAAAPEGVPGLAPVDLTVDRIQLMGMRTAAARRAPLSASLRTVGFVTAPEGGLVSVTTRFTGWIESLGASETGQAVARGQILATVYSPEMINAQQVFLNAIRWSDRREGATQGVAGPTPTASPQLASDLERDARVRLEQLGFAREDIDAIARTGKPTSGVNVRSPVRGYVARRSAIKGLYVQPGTELFQIADLSRVWVLADVYEGEIGRVAVGQKATLALAAWPGETFTGRVTFLYPAINTGSRTLQARLEFPNPGLRLRPGMYGDVTLEVGASEAVVVPREALVDTGEVQYVFVARGGGRFEPRRVRVGLGGEGQVAILSGLAEGESVVTSAAFLLDSESRLRAALAPAR
jgi:Cu(I)/Ag(I) efflux system membrane fusion protein